MTKLPHTKPANFLTGIEVAVQRQGVFSVSTGSKALDAILGGIPRLDKP